MYLSEESIFSLLGGLIFNRGQIIKGVKFLKNEGQKFFIGGFHIQIYMHNNEYNFMKKSWYTTNNELNFEYSDSYVFVSCP